MYDVRQTIDELNKIHEAVTELQEQFPEGGTDLEAAFELLEDARMTIAGVIDLVTAELKVIDGMEGG